MITPIVKDTKVIFGPCRLSYTHIFNKYAPDGDTANGKYMTNILIPKKEKETIKALQQAIAAAKDVAVTSKWSGKEPKKLDNPLRDGNDKEKDENGIYAECFYLNAKSTTRPGVVDENKAPIIDEEEIYSGVWAIVSVTFYGYDVSGNRGIACGLNNIMKFKDDERLGGHVSAESDFADIDIDRDVDDDDDWK